MILPVGVLVALLVRVAFRHEWPGTAPVRSWWREHRHQLIAFVRGSPATFIYLAILMVTTWVLVGSSPKVADALLVDQSTNLHHLTHDPVHVLVRSGFPDRRTRGVRGRAQVRVVQSDAARVRRYGLRLVVDQGAAAESFSELAGLLSRRIMELANTADDDARAAGIREVFATEYILHSRTGGTVVGVDDYIERIAGNLAGIPNMHFEMDDLVVQGDRFALRYHWTAPYGDGTIGNEALEINRVASGQVAETWNYQDRMSLMIQLGVIQDPFAPTS